MHAFALGTTHVQSHISMSPCAQPTQLGKSNIYRMGVQLCSSQPPPLHYNQRYAHTHTRARAHTHTHAQCAHNRDKASIVKGVCWRSERSGALCNRESARIHVRTQSAAAVRADCSVVVPNGAIRRDTQPYTALATQTPCLAVRRHSLDLPLGPSSLGLFSAMPPFVRG